MYAIVLAATMTAGSAAPDLHFRGGCYGCSGGNAFSSCYGCYGSSCYGCYGSSSYGCYGSSCYGCYGSSSYGCTGSSCYGCRGGCWGASASFGSCYGCYGSGVSGGGVYYEAYGGFSGCSGCFGGCFGGCTGYYGGAMPTYFAPVQPAPGQMPPAETKKNGKEAEVSAPATVVLKAPLGAKVTVNGQAATRRTAEESFETPALVVGRTYAYNFEASMEKDGQTVTATRRITVEANGRTVVDFSDLANASDKAKVTVLLPEGAKLSVNDQPYGSERTQTFDTPKLEKGKRYYYTVKAESKRNGQPVTETRRVTVEAGKAITVDFTASSKEVLTASR